MQVSLFLSCLFAVSLGQYSVPLPPDDYVQPKQNPKPPYSQSHAVRPVVLSYQQPKHVSQSAAYHQLQPVTNHAKPSYVLKATQLYGPAQSQQSAAYQQSLYSLPPAPTKYASVQNAVKAPSSYAQQPVYSAPAQTPTYAAPAKAQSPYVQQTPSLAPAEQPKYTAPQTSSVQQITYSKPAPAPAQQAYLAPSQPPVLSYLPPVQPAQTQTYLVPSSTAQQTSYLPPLQQQINPPIAQQPTLPPAAKQEQYSAPKQPEQPKLVQLPSYVLPSVQEVRDAYVAPTESKTPYEKPVVQQQKAQPPAKIIPVASLPVQKPAVVQELYAEKPQQGYKQPVVSYQPPFKPIEQGKPGSAAAKELPYKPTPQQSNSKYQAPAADIQLYKDEQANVVKTPYQDETAYVSQPPTPYAQPAKSPQGPPAEVSYTAKNAGSLYPSNVAKTAPRPTPAPVQVRYETPTSKVVINGYTTPQEYPTTIPVYQPTTPSPYTTGVTYFTPAVSYEEPKQKSYGGGDGGAYDKPNGSYGSDGKQGYEIVVPTGYKLEYAAVTEPNYLQPVQPPSYPKTTYEAAEASYGNDKQAGSRDAGTSYESKKYAGGEEIETLKKGSADGKYDEYAQPALGKPAYSQALEYTEPKPKPSGAAYPAEAVKSYEQEKDAYGGSESASQYSAPGKALYPQAAEYIEPKTKPVGAAYPSEVATSYQKEKSAYGGSESASQYSAPGKAPYPQATEYVEPKTKPEEAAYPAEVAKSYEKESDAYSGSESASQYSAPGKAPYPQVAEYKEPKIKPAGASYPGEVTKSYEKGKGTYGGSESAGQYTAPGKAPYPQAAEYTEPKTNLAGAAYSAEAAKGYEKEIGAYAGSESASQYSALGKAPTQGGQYLSEARQNYENAVQVIEAYSTPSSISLGQKISAAYGTVSDSSAAYQADVPRPLASNQGYETTNYVSEYSSSTGSKPGKEAAYEDKKIPVYQSQSKYEIKTEAVLPTYGATASSASSYLGSSNQAYSGPTGSTFASGNAEGPKSAVYSQEQKYHPDSASLVSVKTGSSERELNLQAPGNTISDSYNGKPREATSAYVVPIAPPTPTLQPALYPKEPPYAEKPEASIQPVQYSEGPGPLLTKSQSAPSQLIYQDKNAFMPYRFAWAVKDNYGNDFGQEHDSDAYGITNGQYRVVLPDGRLQTVTYKVTPNDGYTANVKYKAGSAYR